MTKLEKWKKLANEATPGPWYEWELNPTDEVVISTIPKSQFPPDRDKWESEDYKRETNAEVLGTSEWLRAKENDLRFMIASREAVTVLIECLEMAMQTLQEYSKHHTLWAPGKMASMHCDDQVVIAHPSARVLKEIREKLEEK